MIDLLIVGTGIAGLNCALEASKQGLKVTMVTKGKFSESNSAWAQGGIAGVIADSDSVAEHVEDTLRAGAQHNNKEAVELLINKSKTVIEQLDKYGVPFAKSEDGQLCLTQEGGHSQRRIAYVEDTTGKAIQDALFKLVQADSNISVTEYTYVVDLLISANQCLGIVALAKEQGLIEMFANQIVLATGGLGQLYEHTTNPMVATGDGVAMAYRAEGKIKDLEFIQFHPTVFIDDQPQSLLVSEAVRGEGGYVVDETGERFLFEYVESGELACRDEVARAIHAHRLAGHKTYIDVRHLKEFADRFPFINQSLLNRDINPAKDLIPIAPASHFACGGVETNLSGATSIEGLYACGEVACTGVHGANRLASNSLLEAMVFGGQIAKAAASASSVKKNTIGSQQSKDWGIAFTSLSAAPQKKLAAYLAQMQAKTKQLMTEKVGIVRTGPDLEIATKQLTEWEGQLLNLAYGDFSILVDVAIASDAEDLSSSLLAVKYCQTLNMLQSAILIAESASKRSQSLGGHWIVI